MENKENIKENIIEQKTNFKKKITIITCVVAILGIIGVLYYKHKKQIKDNKKPQFNTIFNENYKLNEPETEQDKNLETQNA